MVAKKAAASKVDAPVEDVDPRTTDPSVDGPQTGHPEVLAANEAHGVNKKD